MGKITRILCVLILGIVFIGQPFYIAESATTAAELIQKAKIYIQNNDKEKAISALDAAFELADSAGDVEALMEIGDLYVKIDPSLKDKAMKAWTSAGRWKCR